MMTMRAVLTLATLVAVIVAIPGHAAAQDQSVPAAPAPGSAMPPPLPSGPAPDLDLVFTAEVVGYVEPCG